MDDGSSCLDAYTMRATPNINVMMVVSNGIVVIAMCGM